MQRKHTFLSKWKIAAGLIMLGGLLAFVRFTPAAPKTSRAKFSLPASRPVVSAKSLEQVMGLERAFVEVAEGVGPAVVSVVATQVIQQRGRPDIPPGVPHIFDEWFYYFFGPQREMPQRRKPQEMPKSFSAGSGVIVTPDGYLLTNAHVIGEATDVSVYLRNNKKEYKAKIIGTDIGTDIAVLKIKSSGKLATAPLGDSDQIHVGQWAIAIGTPFRLENTVTVGVISAKGRRNIMLGVRKPAEQFTSFIQTDASINKGNSGGPLLNIKGEVIGINTMILSPSGGSVGIGFAIPVNTAKSVMEQLIRDGKIVRPQLGVAYQPVDPDVAKELGLPEGVGMEIINILKGTAADRAGLKPGDIILRIGKKTLKDADDLRSTVLQRQVGDRMTLEIVRRGKKLTKVVKLRELQSGETRDRQARRRTPKTRKGEAKWLGMTLIELGDDMAEQLRAQPGTGLVVFQLEPDSPASRAGIRAFDIIREIRHRPVASLNDLAAARRRIRPKDNVLLLVERGGSTMYKVIKPEEPTPEG